MPDAFSPYPLCSMDTWLPMDSYEESGYPFAIPDLWRTTNSPAIQEKKIASPIDCWVLANYSLDLGLDLKGKNEDLPEFFEKVDFSLPNLDEPEFRPLEDLGLHPVSLSPELSDDSLDESETSSDFAQPIEGDTSLCQEVITRAGEHLKLKSWELFNNGGFEEPRSQFISERGAIAFDAAVIAHDEDTGAMCGGKCGRILQSGPLLTGLSLLGLGRQSVLFRYVEAEQTFQPRIEHGRMSGYTMSSFESLRADFVHHGNKMVLMEKFIGSVYTSIDSVQPLVSLASAFSTILSAIRWESSDRLKSAAGLLELQALLREPSLVLSYMGEMKDAVGAVQFDHQLVSRIFRFLQDNEHKDLGLRQIGSQILARASEPWLRSFISRLGIPTGLPNELPKEPPKEPPKGLVVEIPDQNSHETSEKVSPNPQNILHDFETNSISGFISEEDTKVISSIEQGLRAVRAYSPEHPLSRPDRFGVKKSCIPTWHFSWQDVDRIVLQAKEYEERLSEAIRKFHNSDIPPKDPAMDRSSCLSGELDAFDWSGKDSHDEFRASIAEIEKSFDESLPADFGTDSLAQAVTDYIGFNHGTAKAENLIFAPPISLVPLLSFNPIIHAQARLVNHAYLRLLFKDHKLRFHLSILHSFSLLGDGVFAARLSHALFDPDLRSAQRRKGYSRSGVVGLRLGHRESWPPAISELRLALMSILADGFDPDDRSERPSNIDGGLSSHVNFSLRDISEDELKRCMNPHSIEALDFLRLQYRPPAPLDTVLTPLCLDKYDVIFKLLLRCIRMLYVVDHLPHMALHRSTPRQRSKVIYQRFRLEAHHIVVATCGYFFDGIRTNWNMLLQKLNAIESHLDDFDGGEKHGVENLRSFHETVLDRIMFALLLRTRQTQVMKLLEEIFNYVLVFARLSYSDESAQEEIEALYARFQAKVQSFVALCRASSDQRGSGANGHEEFEKMDRGENRGNTMAQLVLRLDMGGYYGLARLE